MTLPRLAMDRATSVRSYDQDGRLSVAVTRITKACVSPYLGNEVPGFRALGLDPARIYMLLRAPEELQAAVESFNDIPLLNEHCPVYADDYATQAKKHVVGTTGSEARFEFPYLLNKIVVWDGAAIALIESGAQRQLSAGYRYTADMTPTTFQGSCADGVMREISANHLSLVEEGRCGPSVMVADTIKQIKGANRRWR